MIRHNNLCYGTKKATITYRKYILYNAYTVYCIYINIILLPATQNKTFENNCFILFNYQEYYNFSRRRSRAILNELSGRYVQNKRGRQKLLDKVLNKFFSGKSDKVFFLQVYSSYENSNLPIYQPTQFEVCQIIQI